MQRLMQLGRPHRRLLVFAFGCMALVALTTGAYAFLMGPALRYLLTGGEAGLERLFAIAPALKGLGVAHAAWALPIAALVIGAVKGVGYLGQFYFVGLFGQQVVVDLRRRIFEKLQRLSPTQRTGLLSGELLSRFTADVAAVEQAATYTVASWLRDTLQIAVLVAVAVALSWKLALLSLLVVPLAVWPASRLTGALLRRTREGQAAMGTLAAQVAEGLGALRTIQAFNAEAAEAARFSHRTGQLERALTRAAWARGAVPGVMEILASVAIALSLAWALTTRAVEPDVLVSFLGALILVYQPAKDLGRVSSFALNAAAALERIEAVRSLPELEARGTREVPPLQRALAFEHVTWAWGDRRALNDVSFSIPRGEVTALVGPSGSGKSTVVALLLRLEVPRQGRVVLDGVDASEFELRAWRRQFALVTQEPLLFSASVLENLRVARPGASLEEVEAACRVASAWDFVAALPRGLETPLGERGVTLSGGQKQRLCLARAVLSGAPVLVLDEATSNLDPQSEREVQAALERVLEGRTVVLIAHREEALTLATRVVRLPAASRSAG